MTGAVLLLPFAALLYRIRYFHTDKISVCMSNHCLFILSSKYDCMPGQFDALRTCFYGVICYGQFGASRACLYAVIC